MRLQMDNSCLFIRHSILRYHPVRESGSSIPLVHLGLRPRHLWVKVCSAFRDTASLVSASTMESPRISRPCLMAPAQPDQNQSTPGVFFPALGMKHGSMPIAIRCPIIGERKWRLNESQSKGFLKFWRNRLSHEQEHLAIWVKFMRPEDVRNSCIVSMMNFSKVLLKFVMLERAAAIISLSWIRGLIFVIVTSFVVTTKLLKIKHLSKFFKHFFRGFLTLFSAFVQGRSAGVSGTPKRAIVVVMS